MWGVLRVLVPSAGQPYTIAATALAHYTDHLCDGGPVDGQAQRFDRWANHVATALDNGRSEHPLVRAYMHSAGLLNLSHEWVESYLAGTRIDLAFPGFAQEADYQRYVDAVTLPACIFLAGAVPRQVSDQRFASSVRFVADGMQRTDVLTDLFEDLRVGRLYLPTCVLDRYGVTRADLEDGIDTPAVQALISGTANSARDALRKGERLLGEISPDYRPLFRCMIDGSHLRLDDVESRGAAAITRRRYHDRPVASLRVIMRSRHSVEAAHNNEIVMRAR